jgi:hypothetical protein
MCSHPKISLNGLERCFYFSLYITINRTPSIYHSALNHELNIVLGHFTLVHEFRDLFTNF